MYGSRRGFHGKSKDGRMDLNVLLVILPLYAGVLTIPVIFRIA
jgi:hypothetical protein